MPGREARPPTRLEGRAQVLAAEEAEVGTAVLPRDVQAEVLRLMTSPELMVEFTLRLLGLEGCADTVVGDAMIRCALARKGAGRGRRELATAGTPGAAALRPAGAAALPLAAGASAEARSGGSPLASCSWADASCCCWTRFPQAGGRAAAGPPGALRGHAAASGPLPTPSYSSAGGCPATLRGATARACGAAQAVCAAAAHSGAPHCLQGSTVPPPSRCASTWATCHGLCGPTRSCRCCSPRAT